MGLTDSEREEILALTDKNEANDKVIIPILVDFDGTVVEHDYPRIGKENKDAVRVMRKFIDLYNVGFILNSTRSGDLTKAAVDWFNERGIKLYGVGLNPSQQSWTSTTKGYGLFSIDDINVGCPLIYEKGKRPRVDWNEVERILEPQLKRISSIL